MEPKSLLEKCWEMSFIGLAFDAAEWKDLCGGYRVPYDPREALRTLERNQDVDGALKELWNELYRQGNVGEVSYAAMPHLVRIYIARGVVGSNTYAMAALIEDWRQAERNPKLPGDLKEAYLAALDKLSDVGLIELRHVEDPELASSIIALLGV